MSERVAEIEIGVDLDDARALAAMHRLEAEYERTIAAIDRQEADVRISGDLTQLKKDLAEAKAMVEAAEKQMTAAVNDNAKKRAKIEHDAAVARERSLKSQVAGLEGAIKSRKAEGEAIDATTKRLEALAKFEAGRDRINAAADRRKEAARKRALADIRREQAVQERADAAAERARTKKERDEQRAEALRQREIAAIPKMQRRYAELAQTIDKLNTSKRKVKRDERASLVVDLKIAEAVAEMEALHRTLERVGGPIDIDVDLHPGRDFGVRLRKTFDQGMRDGGLRTAARDAGILTGVAFSAGMADVVRRNLAPSRILKGIGGGFARVGHALGNLSNMTVRLGPFTATIRQAFVGLSLLAPIILDVVGALGSLVSVVGSATVGLGALTAGFLGGAVPAALGMGLVIKDVVQEFKAVKKAQKAYDDALMKGNTDLAKKKLKELRATMGNVSEETVRQVGLAQKIGKAWDKATKPAHASAWKAVGQGLQTASDLLPMFASRTNESMGIAEKATTRWMKALRSDEGKGILDNLMGNFNQSLGPLLNGLGNIGAYLGRVASLASNRIPKMARQFENWSEKVLGTSDDMGALDKRVGRAIDSLKTLGRFLLAGGRFLKTFFGGGTEAGQGFLDTMTAALDRWTAFLKTTEGHNKLTSFFKEAVSGTQAFYSVLAPLLSSFVRWAASIAPFARAFFEAAGAVGEFVSELLKLTGLRTPLAALATTLGTLWAINRIGGAVRAISGFTTGLLGLGAAQKLLGGAGAAGGLARTGQQLALFGPALGGATKEVGPFRAAAQRLVPAIAEMGALAGGAATAGLFALGGAAAYGLVKLIGMKDEAEKLSEAIDKNRENIGRLKTATDLYQTSKLDLTTQAKSFKGLTKNIADLKDKLAEAKEGTQKYRETLDELNAAIEQRGEMEASIRHLATQSVGAATAGAAAQLGMVEANNNVTKALRARKIAQEQLAKMNDGNDPDGSMRRKQLENIAEAEANLAKAMKTRNGLQAQIDRAQVIQNTLALNTMRVRKGMIAVTGDEQRALARLAEQSRRTARAVAKTYADPRDVGKVSRAASSAIKQSVPKSVTTRIVGDSSSAEEAIRRLRNISIPSKTLKIITDGGPRAIRTLEDIKGAKLTPKEQKIVSQGGPNVLAKLAQIKGSKLAAKILRILGDDAAARRVLARANSATVRQLTQFILRQLRNTGAEFPPPPPTKQFVDRVLRSGGAGVNRTPATGGVGGTGFGTPTASTASHQERAHERAMQGMLPRGSTGQAARGMKVSGPRAIWGEEPQHPEYVISTNPSYRESNIGYLRRAAASLGIEMAATGKNPFGKYKKGNVKDPALSNKGAARARREARKNLKARTTPRRYKSDNLVELATVEKRRRQENNFRDIVQREASFVDNAEPKTFLRKTGEDSEGNDIFEVDTTAVEEWNKKLVWMAGRFDELVKKVMATLEAVKAAMIRIGNPYGKADKTSVIGNAKANIEAISAMLHQQQGVYNNAKTRIGKGRAKERIGVYKAALANEQEKIDNATSDWKMLDEERNDIGNTRRGRIAEATDVANSYRESAGVTQKTAEADMISANPDTSKGGEPDVSPDQQAQIDQASEAARVANRGRSIAESALAAFGSPGDIGSANYANAYMAAVNRPMASPSFDAVQSASSAVAAFAGGPKGGAASSASAWQTASGAPAVGASGGAAGVTINVSTLHPGDPATLDAIGKAATAGIGFQGFRDTPRAGLGY